MKSYEQHIRRRLPAVKNVTNCSAVNRRRKIFAHFKSWISQIFPGNKSQKKFIDFDKRLQQSPKPRAPNVWRLLYSADTSKKDIGNHKKILNLAGAWDFNSNPRDISTLHISCTP